MSQPPPDHWKSYLGPSNWFQIWHPPEWELQELESGTQLISPQKSSTLRLQSFWLSDEERSRFDAWAGIRQIFPRQRNVSPLNALNVPYESVGLRGEAILEPEASWWKRLFAKWHKWRIWLARHKGVCLVAVYVEVGAADPEEADLVRMMLNTLEFAEEPADPPRLFAERVVELARAKFPLLDCELDDEFQLRFGESKVNLFNFYRSYVNSPDRFQEIVLPALTTVVQVQEWGETLSDPPLDHVRDRIMPMLYPQSVWEENFPNFIGDPWVAGLMTLYVVDESRAYWYIRDDLLETWGITRSELHDIALANLDDYFDEHAMELMMTGAEDGPRMLMPNRPDAYNTSRLLSYEFHAKLRQVLGSEFAVGIPNRDFFVAVSLDSEETVEHVRLKVLEDFSRMDHPLSDRLLLVSADGVSEYVEG